LLNFSKMNRQSRIIKCGRHIKIKQPIVIKPHGPFAFSKVVSGKELAVDLSYNDHDSTLSFCLHSLFSTSWFCFSLSGSRRGCTDVEFTGKGNILESKSIAFPCTFSINKGISTLDMSPALCLKAFQGSLWYNTFIVLCFLVFDKLSKDFCNCMSFSQAWANWFPWNRFNPMNIHLIWTH